MHVVLAGYNVDSQVLAEARSAGVAADQLTPEVFSAAYARISRDPRPVDELRREARQEVGKARASNRKIIFEMGHHSVAEHAVFNLDIIGLSRLAIEWLEHFRLCSFTEKSQRYITLDHDRIAPVELEGTDLLRELASLQSNQIALYEKAHAAFFALLQEDQKDLCQSKAGHRLVDGWAKEDARYATLLSTTGQLGLTANARNLELIARRAAASPLGEVRELGEALRQAASAVAPSLLLFTEPCAFDKDTKGELTTLAAQLMREVPAREPAPAAQLVRTTQDGDLGVAASLLCAASREPFGRCLSVVRALSRAELEEIFKTAFRKMEFYDAPTRELEHASATFEVVVSAACFAQLKRHRMMTISAQEYDPSLGLSVPPIFARAGLEDELLAHAARSAELFDRIRQVSAAAAAYALTNAHRRRVLVTSNLRELYHFCRLREDNHAQWDIRLVAAKMRELVALHFPLAAQLLGGKDTYPERYARLFGHLPQAKP